MHLLLENRKATFLQVNENLVLYDLTEAILRSYCHPEV